MNLVKPMAHVDVRIEIFAICCVVALFFCDDMFSLGTRSVLISNPVTFTSVLWLVKSGMPSGETLSLSECFTTQMNNSSIPVYPTQGCKQSVFITCLHIMCTGNNGDSSELTIKSRMSYGILFVRPVPRTCLSLFKDSSIMLVSVCFRNLI